MGTIQALGRTSVDGPTSQETLNCDQAIFTSIRTHMGEGYRIIAASRGLRADDKQAITRYCPSHEGLCNDSPQAYDRARSCNAIEPRAVAPPLVGGVPRAETRIQRRRTIADAHLADPAPDPEAVAFYTLPSGRLCAAFSRFAGAEHTGRGGLRVYTHCAVFNEKDFERCGYNAFNVIRAMVAAGLTSPMLKPTNPLPELQLSVNASPDEAAGLALHPTLDAACRCRVLQGLFDERSMIIDIEDAWLGSTETLLLGLPGPMRSKVSFSAGARFSLGRDHRLHLLHDASGQARTRVAGQPIDFINPREPRHPDMPDSAWLTFVERRLSTGDTARLAKQTSRPFADVGPAGRERIGQLYNHIDDIPETDTATLVALAVDHLQSQDSGVERELADELANKAEHELKRRFAALAWSEAKPHWSVLVKIHGHSSRGASYVQPLMQLALRRALRDDPLDAAAAALDVASHAQSTTDTPPFAVLIDEVLRRLASWALTAPDIDRDELHRLCDRWQPLRPNCPIIDEIRRNCAAPTASG